MTFFKFTQTPDRELNDEVGFFFSCFKEKDAVNFCIKNIRSHYPENPIFLSSDGGLDFSHLQDDDKNLKFTLYEDKLGYVNHPETKDKEKLIDCCVEFLNRLNAAVDFCRTEFIMYYEPDVLLRGKVRINQGLHLNGSFANRMDESVMNFIHSINPHCANINFGSCGGSVINSASFKEVYSKTDLDLIRKLIYLDPRISNCDFLLTVLFSIHGYRYDENLDFIEARRDTNWMNTSHSIVHQYHHNYGVNYDGKYANFK